MRTYLMMVIAFLLSTSIARSDVTVCNGDDCTVVSGSIVRKLTAEEVKAKKIREAREKVYSFDCEDAVDRKKCYELRKELLELYPPH